MITSSILSIFLGCFTLYNTSKEVLLRSNLSIEKWIQANHKLGKFTGCAFLILGLLLAIFSVGKTSGIVLWLFITTTILSLFIILYPLKIINYKHILVLLIIMYIIEIITNL